MIEEAARRFGVEVETTAEDALLSALSRSKGLVIYYQARVSALPPDQLVYGSERVTRVRRGEGADQVVEDITVAKTSVNIWVRLLQQAEDRHFRIAAKIAELQIEARRVRLADEQAELFYSSLIKALGLFGISEDDERIPAFIPLVMGEIVG